MFDPDKVCQLCINPETYISTDRILIKQDPNKYGIIELRPGLTDMNLGDKQYSMVRIFLGPSRHYIKGMCLYSDDIPDDYDLIFYTKLKFDGTFLGYCTIKHKLRTQKSFEIIENDYGNWDEWKNKIEQQLAYEFLRK